MKSFQNGACASDIPFTYYNVALADRFAWCICIYIGDNTIGFVVHRINDN